jgi:hypothetical protein
MACTQRRAPFRSHRWCCLSNRRLARNRFQVRTQFRPMHLFGRVGFSSIAPSCACPEKLADLGLDRLLNLSRSSAAFIFFPPPFDACAITSNIEGTQVSRELGAGLGSGYFEPSRAGSFEVNLSSSVGRRHLYALGSAVANLADTGSDGRVTARSCCARLRHLLPLGCALICWLLWQSDAPQELGKTRV